MGDRIACFLVEPVLGSGGGMAATQDYLTEARRLTEKHGALLLCDEIITGFRFRAGPDLDLRGTARPLDPGQDPRRGNAGRRGRRPP